MKRRHFAFGLSAAVVLAPGRAIAQQKSAHIGVLSTGSRTQRSETSYYEDAFLPTLAKAGWVEGRNLVIDWRFADGNLERHTSLAEDLVALNPNLILATTQPSAVAVMKATKTIPIVFALVHEPIESGLAESLARPGKNATGLVSMNVEIMSKRIERLLMVVPTATRIALLYLAEVDVNLRQVALAEQILQSLNVKAIPVNIGRPQNFAASFDVLARERPDAVLVIENPVAFTNRAEIVRRITSMRLPAMYGFGPFAVDGGLMSYSIDFADQFRRAAGYVDRILRGANAAELPIEQPVRLEMIVNRKAASAIGITLPRPLLLIADRVID